MKKYRFLSFVLTLALVFSITAPIAYAAELNKYDALQMSTPITIGDYTFSGVENEDVRFNIFINETDQTGQFAIVYLDSPDYVYEFFFDLDDVVTNASKINFSEIQAYCFENENQWKKIYIPSAITVEEENKSQAVEAENKLQAVATDEVAEIFEDWLINEYGNEFSGHYLNYQSTRNGVTMYLKDAFQVYAYRDQSYLINVAISVAGFVTGIWGYNAQNIMSIIGAIVGVGGMLTIGEEVQIYVLRANWFKYATIGSGTGYPYGLSDKFTFFDGYYYTGTGGHDVDELSESTSYVPSSSVYNSNTNVMNNAFDEYNRIGYQPGNF